MLRFANAIHEVQTNFVHAQPYGAIESELGAIIVPQTCIRSLLLVTRARVRRQFVTTLFRTESEEEA